MNNNFTQGFSLYDLARYLINHIRMVFILVLILSVGSFAILYMRSERIERFSSPAKEEQSSIGEERKEELNKLAEIYIDFWDKGYNDIGISTSDRMTAAYYSELLKDHLTNEELIYFNQQIGAEPNGDELPAASTGKSLISLAIISIGFGIIVSISICLLRCAFAKELMSQDVFKSRYDLKLIPRGDVDGITGYIKSEVEELDVKNVVITGTALDDDDHSLIDAICDRLKEIGVEGNSFMMDVNDASIMGLIKKAGMIIVMEHMNVSKLDAIDDEIQLIREVGVNAVIRAII